MFQAPLPTYSSSLLRGEDLNLVRLLCALLRHHREESVGGLLDLVLLGDLGALGGSGLRGGGGGGLSFLQDRHRLGLGLDRGQGLEGPEDFHEAAADFLLGPGHDHLLLDGPEHPAVGLLGVRGVDLEAGEVDAPAPLGGRDVEAPALDRLT